MRSTERLVTYAGVFTDRNEETVSHCGGQELRGLSTIIVSGGKIGAQVEVSPQDLLRLVQGTVAEIAVEP